MASLRAEEAKAALHDMEIQRATYHGAFSPPKKIVKEYHFKTENHTLKVKNSEEEEIQQH